LSVAKPITFNYARAVTNYRRNFISGGSFFSTANLAERRLRLFVDDIVSRKMMGFAAVRPILRARHNTSSTTTRDLELSINADPTQRVIWIIVPIHTYAIDYHDVLGTIGLIYNAIDRYFLTISVTDSSVHRVLGERRHAEQCYK
jgi:hypothetical protein